ncbi:leucine-rich repeat domain-containing protein, partial [Porphyromonas uenonis]|uniref:leucine-rich repeat domain-containing protein n=1 Tax=Porphyromonas uenonis TaxID=281920 RepID=UPI00397CA22D
MTTLNCGSNQLTSLDLSSCTALTTLNCGSNQLTSLNVSSYTSLKTLNCSNNQLTSLDLSGCTALKTLDCGENPVFDSLDVSGCTSLTKLDCKKSSSPKKLNASGCTALTEFDCREWSLISLDVSGCTSLIKLTCPKHYLTNLNASGCSALKMLDCSGDSLTNLNLSGCTSLTMFFFINNRLVSLNISGCTALTKLACSRNQLTSLDASGCTALKTLDCRDNKLTSLNVSGCTALKTLDCSDNTLSDINLLQCFELNWLRCSINQIKASSMTALINSLPDRQGKTVGMLQVVDKESTKEGNLCFTDHVTKAKAKNWQAQSYQSNAWSDYAGSEVPTFAVTSSATTGGMVAIIGVPDLTKVPYDTELTIVATPAEGYELTALTANGTDILASKKVIVKEAVEVKATFAKKSFAVTFDKVGEGTITATGADDLNAVAYGTELTIVATPAAGYDLQSLVAGGVDITTTKKVVVKDNVTVTATFAKKNFAVTFEKEGEGTITATGASDLNSVAYGTELTINATPAMGYELVSITANGTDITATKKI